MSLEMLCQYVFNTREKFETGVTLLSRLEYDSIDIEKGCETDFRYKAKQRIEILNPSN